ncbi:MAG TPA: thiamine pyrophosphate-binding protein, partial [Polyangiaceae bacterium]|nr:thiamine pyrophosphate-binding protein [Polyangiaceae bacterium]
MESATRGPFALSDDAQPSSPQRLHSGVMPVIRPAQTLSESLVATLVELGVKRAFGVIGGAIGPFCRALDNSPIDLLHFRHEGGAAFAAIEAS